MARVAHGARNAAVAVAAIALLGACYEYTGPESEPAHDEPLTGAFTWARDGAPGPAEFDTFSIYAARGVITGTGHSSWPTPGGTPVMSFSISGTYSDTTQSFEMTFDYAARVPATYVGKAWGWDSLSGTWTDDYYYIMPLPYHLKIDRVPVPPCANPAKALPALPHAGASGPFIVQFRDSVDVPTEAERLADKYGFVVTRLYQQNGFNGFTASISAGTVAVLLCEPSVVSVE